MGYEKSATRLDSTRGKQIVSPDVLFVGVVSPGLQLESIRPEYEVVSPKG